MKITINDQDFDLNPNDATKYRWYFIRCASKGADVSKKGMSLSYLSDQKVVNKYEKNSLIDEDNHTNLVPWLVKPVPGKNNQYYLINKYKASAGGADVGKHLSFYGSTCCLYPKDNTYDLTPWEFTAVPGKDDEFYITNQWHAPNESRVGKYMGYGSSNIISLTSKDDTNNRVAWKFTPARLTGSEVISIIHHDIPGRLAADMTPRISDYSFYPPSLHHAREVIGSSNTNQLKWTAERFDCDDFAVVLKSDFALDSYHNLEMTAAHAFGLMWGSIPEGGHAINWMINDDLKFRMIEPQSDEIWLPGAAGGEDFRHIYFMMV